MNHTTEELIARLRQSVIDRESVTGYEWEAIDGFDERTQADHHFVVNWLEEHRPFPCPPPGTPLTLEEHEELRFRFHRVENCQAGGDYWYSHWYGGDPTAHLFRVTLKP